MPKKSATARSGAQRQRPRTQKSFELVRPTAIDNTTSTADAQQDEESTRQSVATMTATTHSVDSDTDQDTLTEETLDSSEELNSEPVPISSARKTSASNTSSVLTSSVLPPTPVTSTTRGGAAARFAARRQAQQKAQQRNVQSLVTTEHFAYVRHDLVIITILACIMFAAIIILYFTIGR